MFASQISIIFSTLMLIRWGERRREEGVTFNKNYVICLTIDSTSSVFITNNNRCIHFNANVEFQSSVVCVYYSFINNEIFIDTNTSTGRPDDLYVNL